MPDATAVPHDRIAHWRLRADAALVTALDARPAAEPHLHAAMRHAALLGGKRMRPLLVYATGDLFGLPADALDDAAAAIELIHAYSLVHDDLPSMDDDALRRGQPTVHVAFGEATAILCGDALQALAFERLAGAALPAERRVAMLGELAIAAGAAGMCGGQALDLAATGGGAPGTPGAGRASGHEEAPLRGQPPNSGADPASDQPTSGHPDDDQPASERVSALERLHALKTGALLRAAVRLGALAADADAEDVAHLDRFADALGLAFQIRDDLLDVEGDTATLGKTAGKDIAQAKTTFPALLGLDASRARLQGLGDTMDAALASFGPRARTLAALGRLAIERDR